MNSPERLVLFFCISNPTLDEEALLFPSMSLKRGAANSHRNKVTALNFPNMFVSSRFHGPRTFLSIVSPLQKLICNGVYQRVKKNTANVQLAFFRVRI